jgi:FlaG/FlaF family flagellin (archaellin)
MSDSSPSRRALLRTCGTLGGLAAAGSLTGCTGVLDSDAGSTKLDSVPSGATTVAYADVAGFLGDDDVRSNLNDRLSGMELEVGSVADGLDRIESQVGLDPRGLTELLTFGEAGRDASFGAIVWTDWSESDVLAAAEENGTGFTESTYGGTTVYEGDSDANWLGVLGDGQYVLGTKGAVEDVIDTRAGNAEPVSGSVRSAYQNAAAGYARFAFEVTDDVVPEDASGQLAAFQSVQTGYGSVSASGDASFQLTLTATDADSAANVADVIEGGLATFRNQIEGRSPVGPSGEEMSDLVLGTIDETNVSQDGKTVTIRTAAGLGAVVSVVAAVVASFVLGLGDQQAPRAPQAAFSFAYDESASTVEITHDGGDTIPAANLTVTGSGFADASGADMTGPGPWQGTTSADAGDEPAVAAGDRVTVGITADCDLRLVYREENLSATLAAFEGPDA